MKVFVTGISGFVGAHLVDALLSEGWGVTGISRSGGSPVFAERRRHWGNRVEVIALDVGDTSALTACLREVRPDALVHLAGMAFPPEANRHPRGGLESNFYATVSLLEAVRDAVPRARVLLPTSGEVYGAPVSLPLCEGQPLRPVSLYGLGKAAADLAGFQAFWRDGLDVIRARPFNHTGPGQAPVFVCSEFARALVISRRGGGSAVLYTGNIEVERDFSDVRDVVCCYRALLKGGKAGEVYNVASGRTVSIRTVLELLETAAGVEVAVKADPEKIRANEIPRIEVSVDAVREATGWTPEIPLEATLESLIRYWEVELSR